MMHSWLRVVEKLHQGVILGFNWLQNVNPKLTWSIVALPCKMVLLLLLYLSIAILKLNNIVLKHLYAYYSPKNGKELVYIF